MTEFFRFLVLLWCALMLAGSIVVLYQMVFSRKRREPKQPKPGEVWQFKHYETSGPWDVGGPSLVTVTDVKDGWIRYDMKSIFKNQVMKASMFTSMYEPTEPN